MALFAPALNFVLNNEDRLRQYAIVPDAGGFAVSGVNSKAWPSEFAQISSLPQDQRAEPVAAFYEQHFWNRWIEALDSQDLADRVMDASVNNGPKMGITLFQQAINSVAQMIEPRPSFEISLQDWPIHVDGAMGPITVAAANKYPADKILEAFRAARIAYYEQIVAADPAATDNLSGWIARAKA